jgi:hypothetical protein
LLASLRLATPNYLSDAKRRALLLTQCSEVQKENIAMKQQLGDQEAWAEQLLASVNLLRVDLAEKQVVLAAKLEVWIMVLNALLQ